MDGLQIVRFVLALSFVLGLIAFLAWFARRSGWLSSLQPPGGVRRLGVVETAIIDPRHKLVLVRCDGTEHLLLLGQAGPLVVARTAQHGAQSGPLQEDAP